MSTILYGTSPTVWYAYFKLYGSEAFRLPIIAACFLHDIGYLGCAEMDGPEGELHPELGAGVMSRLFDRGSSLKWCYFTAFHSRAYAKACGAQFSRLAVADKLALTVTPRWFYIMVSSLTGEIKEYMAEAVSGGYISKEATKKEWYEWASKKMTKWANDNKESGARP